MSLYLYPQIKKIGSYDTSWYDIGVKEVVRGTLHVFKVKDPLSGVWIFRVYDITSLGKIEVQCFIEYSAKVTNMHLFIERRRAIYKEINNYYLYHVVKIPYIDEKTGRLRLKEANNISEIHEFIRRKFRLKKYGEVISSKSKYHNKLVVLLRHNEREIVEEFFYERIRLLFAMDLINKIRDALSDMISYENKSMFAVNIGVHGERKFTMFKRLSNTLGLSSRDLSIILTKILRYVKPEKCKGKGIEIVYVFNKEFRAI